MMKVMFEKCFEKFPENEKIEKSYVWDIFWFNILRAQLQIRH